MERIDEGILGSKKRMAIAVGKALFILVFIYATLSNNQPKTSSGPTPLPFLTANSTNVHDFYYGELGQAIENAQQASIAFIMFYAPWNAESQHVRHQFEEAARFFQNRIRFIAINCWYPNGECRKQFTKSFTWPVLIAYLANGKGIQYKGVNEAAYIIRFLQSVEKPFVRITDLDHVSQLALDYDLVVTACVDAYPGSRNFAVYYRTALEYLETLPLQQTLFTIKTSPCSYSSTFLFVTMWNETLIYDGKWSSNSILHWFSNRIHQLIDWISPPGTKSRILSAYIQPGPTLILFTPRNPLHTSNDLYDMVRMVAFEYNTCSDDDRLLDAKVRAIYQRRMRNMLNYRQMLNDCHSFPTFTSILRVKNRLNYTATCSSLQSSDCSIIDDYYPFYKSKEECMCDSDAHDGTSQMNNLQTLIQLENCLQLKYAQQLSSMTFSRTLLTNQTLDTKLVYGLACKGNASMNFIAIDSVYFHHFAEQLGVDVLNRENRTSLVIVNERAETVYVMKENLNDVSVRQFLRDYADGNVTEVFQPMLTQATYTHSYQMKNSTKDVSVLELNTTTFLSAIKQENKALLVLYYTKVCSFCSGIAYRFLMVAKLFASLSFLTFTRIDGYVNPLPWQYSMDMYPTVIYFPMQRSESMVFPRNMDMTVSNLTNFLLANLNPSQRLVAMWALCSTVQVSTQRLNCLTQLSEEVLTIIGATLRRWRLSSPRLKKFYLYKLQQLRALSLLLVNPLDNHTLIYKHLSKFNSLSLDKFEILKSHEENGYIHKKDEL